MVIEDYQIEIVTGINDTPTTGVEANHPNGSFVTEKYNNLIDELSTIHFNIRYTVNRSLMINDLTFWDSGNQSYSTMGGFTNLINFIQSNGRDSNVTITNFTFANNDLVFPDGSPVNTQWGTVVLYPDGTYSFVPVNGFHGCLFSKIIWRGDNLQGIATLLNHVVRIEV